MDRKTEEAHLANVAIINAEINGLKKGPNYVPKIEPFNRDVFKKTDAEKIQLKNAKKDVKLWELRNKKLNQKS